LTEYDLQVQLVDYMIENFPQVTFRSDLGGVRLHRGLIQKVSKLFRGSKKQGPKVPFPDFGIYEPRGGWFALFIEIKVSKSRYCIGKNPLQKVLRVDDAHIAEQAEMALKLRNIGYYADFAGGWGEVRSLVEWYLLDLEQQTGRPIWPYSVLRGGDVKTK
jgi:hypothetical protein